MWASHPLSLSYQLLPGPSKCTLVQVLDMITEVQPNLRQLPFYEVGKLPHLGIRPLCFSFSVP